MARAPIIAATTIPRATLIGIKMKKQMSQMMILFQQSVARVMYIGIKYSVTTRMAIRGPIKMIAGRNMMKSKVIAKLAQNEKVSSGHG